MRATTRSATGDGVFRTLVLVLSIAAIGFPLQVGAQETPRDEDLDAAPAPPRAPEPPPPPSPPTGTTALAGSFEVRKGETHRGNAYLITPSVRVEGEVDGDLFAVAASADIEGAVLGDVGFVGRSFNLQGRVDDAARIWAADVEINGVVDGELIASGGRVVLGPKAEIRGDAGLYASEIIVAGIVEGDLNAAGGVVRLSGKVRQDASVTCDVFHVEEGSRIEGDLDYSARKKLDVEILAPVVGGEVRYEATVEKEMDAEVERAERMIERTRVIHEDRGSSGLGTRIFAFFAALVVGLLALRAFRGASPTVVGYVSADPLKSLGVGFLTVLSAIAALFAAILIITIPLVLIYWLLLLIAFYLGKIPVAVWLGRWVLAKLRRPASTDGWALVAGLFVLYVVFAIPLIGTWIWFLASLLGLGAIVLGAREHRLARRTPPPPAGGPDSPSPSPSPSPPPAPEPPPATPSH